MNHSYPSLLARRLTRPLAALGLLLATAGAAQAQTASFAAASTYSAGPSSNPLSTAVADVNGDGLVDLLTANYGSGTFGVLLGQAGGGFGAATTYSSGGNNPAGLVVADANGDGRLDLVTVNFGSGSFSILPGQAGGTFGTALTYSTGGNSPVDLAVADVNGDGRLDLVTANQSSNTLGVALGQAGGGFAAATVYSSGGANPRTVAVADVNGDGRLDIVTVNGSSNSAAVLLGQAGGGFAAAATYSTGASTSPYGVAVADVNGDGRLDIVTGNNGSNSVSVLLGQASGSFATATAYATGGSAAFNLSVADLNNDGRPDIVTANYISSNVSVLLGQAGGGFTTATTYATGGNSPTDVALADANGDGKPDLVVANFGSSTVGILLNTTVFAPTLTSINPTSATAGTSVTLTGSNLTGATAVTFTGTSNNTVTTGLTVSGTGNSQTLTVVVPTGANTGNVTVTTPGGVSNGVAFTALPPAAPVAVLPTNNSTTNSSPTFRVTATPGTYVSIYLNGASPGQFITPSSGIIQGTYSGLADGVYTLYATATAQRSGAPVSANSNTLTFTVDGTAPTATISTTSGSPTSTAPIPFSVSFSESVTSPSASSFTVSNGTVTSGPTGSGSGPYTFSVTPTGNGTVSVSLPANAVRDAVGNGNTASGTLSVQYTAPVASGLSVQYQTGDLGQPTDGQLRPFLQLVNTGTSAVPYSSLTVRYWLTPENFMGQLVTPIDYAKLGTGFVSARYVVLPTPRQGAYGYIEYSFAAGAGNLNPGTDSGPIYGKAYKPDYSNFDETDDWSYQTSGSFTTNDHVTLYQDGTLIAGTEPPAVISTTAVQVLSASRDASPSTQYISLQLQVRNTGNVPFNYDQLRVRYYFTRDGATTVVPELDYAQLGSGSMNLRVVNLPTPVGMADAYLELLFTAAPGVFYPRSSTGDILVKLRKENYQAFDQTNDYSFSSATSLTLNDHITALVSNRLVFGTPPNGAPARVAAPSQPASASGATIVAATSSGPQALTASPNPFGEQLTLRFALPATQPYTLAVYDGQGRLVQQVASGEAQAEQAQELVVPTQGYATGLYLVRLTTASGVQTLKLVKQ